MTEDTDARKKEIQLLLAGFVELKTKKEREKTNLNEINVDIQWREIMREAKTKELKQDLLLMKESFSKAVDFKDSIILSLQNEIQQAEVQSMWLACNHMQSLEQLIAVEQKRSELLQQQYEKDISEVKRSFQETKDEIEHNFKSEMLNFKDLDYIEDSVFQDFSQKIKTKFSLMQEDIHEEVCREKNDIVDSFDCSISSTWTLFQSALVRYLEDADTTEKLFAEMKKEYNKLILDTLQDRKITDDLRKSIPQLKAKLVQRESDYKEKVQKVLAGHQEFYANIAELKKKMAKLRNVDKWWLTQLVIDSNAAIKELQKLEHKSARILRLHRRCEKLLAEAQISGMVQDETSLTPKEMEEVRVKFELQSYENKELQNTGQLQKLWETVNQVSLQNLALQKELDDLSLLQIKVKSHVSQFMNQVAEGDFKSEKRNKSYVQKPLVQEAALMFKGKNKDSN